MALRLLLYTLLLPFVFFSQAKEELRIFTFDELTKKPLKCEHNYCSYENKFYKSESSTRSSWLFEKEKSSHYLQDYRKFSHVKLVKKGYVPEIYDISQMKKANDTANIFLKQMHVDFNYNLKNIVFKEDLSIDTEASKYFLSLYKEYFLAKDPRLKITIVNVNSKYAVSEADKTKVAYNLKKLLGSEERVNIKIDNSLPAGNNNEVTFKVLALSEG